MRITALLGMAALAASAISASADVYSLNIVGYYNVTMKGGGLTLVANQLNKGGNTVNEVIPTAPFGSQVLTFVNNDYVIDVFDGTAWLDNNTLAPSTTTLPTGKGFFFNNGDTPDLTATFVGEVVTGTSTLTMPAGLALLGTKTPQALALTVANGFPQVFGMQYLAFDNSINDYVISVNDGTQWLDNNTLAPVTVQPAVGAGWFISNGDATPYTWTTTLNP
jgi:hypothetical protein